MKLNKYRLRTIINEEAKKMGIKLLSEKTEFISPDGGPLRFVWDPRLKRFKGLVTLEAEFDVPENDISAGDNLGTLNIMSMLYNVRGAISYKDNFIFKIVDDNGRQIVSEAAAEMLGYLDRGTGKAIESFTAVLTRAKADFTEFLKEIAGTNPALFAEYQNGIRGHNRDDIPKAGASTSRRGGGFDPLNPSSAGEFDPLGGGFGGGGGRGSFGGGGGGARPTVTPRSATPVRGPARPSDAVAAVVGLIKTQGQAVVNAGDALQRAIEANPELKKDAAIAAALRAYENAALEFQTSLETPGSGEG